MSTRNAGACSDDGMDVDRVEELSRKCDTLCFRAAGGLLVATVTIWAALALCHTRTARDLTTCTLNTFCLCGGTKFARGARRTLGRTRIGNRVCSATRCTRQTRLLPHGALVLARGAQVTLNTSCTRLRLAWGT
jgi:hypothetical protein